MEQTAALEALAALAHQTRLEVFRRLVRAGPGGLNAGAIGESLAVPAPTLSFHLKELRQAGLVESEREGRTQRYRAAYGTMDELLAFLTDNCCAGFADERTAGCGPEAGTARATLTTTGAA